MGLDVLCLTVATFLHQYWMNIEWNHVFVKCCTSYICCCCFESILEFLKLIQKCLVHMGYNFQLFNTFVHKSQPFWLLLTLVLQKVLKILKWKFHNVMRQKLLNLCWNIDWFFHTWDTQKQKAFLSEAPCVKNKNKHYNWGGKEDKEIRQKLWNLGLRLCLGPSSSLVLCQPLPGYL